MCTTSSATQQQYHLSLMTGEVDVGDVAGPDRLVDASRYMRLGRAHRHVAHQVRKVQRQECLHQGVGAMVCQAGKIVGQSLTYKITSQVIKGHCRFLGVQNVPV